MSCILYDYLFVIFSALKNIKCILHSQKKNRFTYLLLCCFPCIFICMCVYLFACMCVYMYMFWAFMYVDTFIPVCLRDSLRTCMCYDNSRPKNKNSRCQKKWYFEIPRKWNYASLSVLKGYSRRFVWKATPALCFSVEWPLTSLALLVLRNFRDNKWHWKANVNNDFSCIMKCQDM